MFHAPLPPSYNFIGLNLCSKLKAFLRSEQDPLQKKQIHRSELAHFTDEKNSYL